MNQVKPMKKNLKNAFDSYTIFAQYLPALLSALPFFVTWYYVPNDDELKGLASFLLDIKLLSVEAVSFSLVFLHFYSLIIREVSKRFQRKYFTGPGARGFPTTYLMLYSDPGLSDGYKDKFRYHVLKRFDFLLLDKEEEKADMIEARKRLDEAIGLIRSDVQHGYLVFKHNIWYGSLRNLLGGIIFSMFLCIVGIIIGWLLVETSKHLVLILAVLFLLYLILFLLRRAILVNNAEAYAKQLFAEFIRRGECV